MTELKRRMIQDMELHGLLPGTQKTYLEAIKNLARHFKRSPDLISEQEIRDFFVYLTKTRRLAPSTIRGYLYAMKFLYEKTLRRNWPVLRLIRVKRTKKLPVVLSPEEVRHVLGRVRRPQARMSLTLMYVCGLRVSEATHLRAADVDSRRMVVNVRGGKGNKDRQVPLPARTLEQLRAYWRQHRPQTWLFPATNGLTAIDSSSVRRCLQSAARQSDITKPISCHTLRHSYATHLLDRGVDIRVIQALLGHRSIKSTLIYTHVSHSTLQAVHGTIDDLTAHL